MAIAVAKTTVIVSFAIPQSTVALLLSHTQIFSVLYHNTLPRLKSRLTVKLVSQGGWSEGRDFTNLIKQIL